MAKSSQPPSVKLTNKEEEHLQELKRELQKQLDRKDALNIETANLTKTLQSLEAQLEKPKIEDNVWYQRYQHQYSYNMKLENQLQQLEEQIQELKSLQQPSRGNKVDQSHLSEIEWRHFLQQLLREKRVLEWELHSEEWRLNKEAKAVHKTEENLSEVQTKLNEASMKLIDTLQSKQVNTPQPGLSRETTPIKLPNTPQPRPSREAKPIMESNDDNEIKSQSQPLLNPKIKIA